MKRYVPAFALVLAWAFAACSNLTGGGSEDSASTYSVTYNGNGSTGGSAPVDSTKYAAGATVTVLANTGSLAKTGFVFGGWNAAADGSGTSYLPAATFIMGKANVTLYAKWTSATTPSYTVTYNGNGNTGGSVPVDGNLYQAGQLVTVLGNSGSLVRSGYVFDGWNALADGTGSGYVAGQTFSMGGANAALFAKWAASAGLDASFNPGTGTTGPYTYNGKIWALAVQNDGKILIGGYFDTYNGTTINHIARLNADGTLDTSFNSGGSGADGYVYSMALQSDGKILIGGQFTGYNGTSVSAVIRLTSSGELDTSFQYLKDSTHGTDASGTVCAIAVQSDGKVLIGGSFSSYDGTEVHNLARLKSDGTLDTSFSNGLGTGTDGCVWTLAVQSDGKILIGGDFGNYNSTSMNRLARVNADGTLDSAFSPGIVPTSGVYSVGLQSDGKILLGGGFTQIGATVINRIARLNTDGTIDSAFTPGGGADGTVWSLLLQSDGKILIAGDFAACDGTARGRVARLNADGTLDGLFNPASGADAQVRKMALQSDGRLLLAGEFTTYNGTGRSHVARIFD